MKQSSKSPTKSKAKEEKIVYRLTKTTAMKFRPQTLVQKGGSLMTRVKSLGKYFSKGPTPNVSREEAQGSIKKESQSTSLCFLHRLEPDTYMVGNRNQLDALSINTFEDYIETQYLWSFRPGQTILNLLVDDRRRTIVIVVQGQMRIYSYEPRRSSNPPKLQKTFRSIDEVKSMQMAKDSFLTVFYEKKLSAFSIDGLNSKQVSEKVYKIDGDLKFYRSANCIQNVLNLFFQRDRPKVSQNQRDSFFELWCLPIQLVGQKLNQGQLQKVYEINTNFKESLTIQSVNKQCFFMNLGQELLLFIRGYKVDNVFINIKTGQSLLKSFGDKKIIHVAPSQIDFYNLKIQLQEYPPRMKIQSFDSVPIIQNKAYKYLDTVKFEDHKVAFFFQKPLPNSSGEIRYEFCITAKCNFQQKVSSLLPKISEYAGPYQGGQYEQLMFDIQAGCEAVSKMGVSRKEAYLMIWTNSKRQHLEEFKFLLDTRDYSTIREEILKKLKKRSMQSAVVQKMQQGCLGMLSQKIFAPNGYNMDDLKNYFTSHLLIRKLDLFKQFKLLAPKKPNQPQSPAKEGPSPIMIDIQQYTTMVQKDLKAELLELIYNMCKFKKDNSKKIRVLLKHFKFAFRSIYVDLLKEIVDNAKENLLELLQAIPQLLPFEYPSQFLDNQAQDPALYRGVLSPLTEEQFDKALYLENVATIYNRELLDEFSRNIWIKRNWMTYHDCVFKNKRELKDSAQLNGDKLFLSVIQYIYNIITDSNRIKETITFLQEKYVSFPKYLKGNVFLYRQLYDYFKENKLINQTFQVFLSKQDQQIFKKIFDNQKIKKGSLLKQIKPIFQNIGQSDKFNYGLLNFFSSNLSQLSDIKYLLNRINNQKREFHAQNEQMYEVLVKGMQIKLKLGSQKDIPIDEVLIYIENIPLTSGNPVTQDLSLIQRINKIGSLFQAMKLNMNIFEMSKNRDAVLLCTLAYAINQKGIVEHPAPEFVSSNTKVILAQAAAIRQQIYGPSQDTVLLFLYLTQLMKHQHLIPLIPMLISENSTPQIPFTAVHLQSLVFFCYKRKVSQVPKYSQSKQFLQSIIAMLPEDNSLRIFITNQIALAQIFGDQISYPICGQSGIITKHIIIGLIEHLNKDQILKLDLANLYSKASLLQRLASGNNTFSEHDLSQVAFTNMLRLGAVPDAVSYIQTMYNLEPQSINNALCPILIFRCICNQLTEQNKGIMTSMVSRSYGKAIQMAQFFSNMFSSSWSNDGQKRMITDAMQGTTAADQYNPQNMLFSDTLLTFLKQNPGERQRVGLLLQKQFAYFMRTNQDFIKSRDVILINMLLLHNPILIIRYIDIYRYRGFNLKQFRAYLSYLSKYELFDAVKLMEYMKRAIKVLYQHEKGVYRLNDLIHQHFSTPLTEIAEYGPLVASNQNESKLLKGLDRAKAKLKTKLNASAIKKSQADKSAQSKYNKILSWLEDSSHYFPNTDYPFYDSDNAIERRDVLKMPTYTQGAQGGWFLTPKWLHWFLMRTNQHIEYYLLKKNESDIDNIMREEEDKLRLSFRPAPRVKQADNPEVGNAVLAGVVEQEHPMGNIAISNIPKVQASAISVIQIVQEIEEVRPASTQLKAQILGSYRVEEDRVLFGNQILNKIPIGQLQSSITQLVYQLYSDSQIEYMTLMMMLRQIHRQHSKNSPINLQAVQTYAKIEQLQKKVGLGVSVRQLMPVSGILIKQKDSQTLFSHVKESLIPYLNENNIHTLPRVISLSFKMPPIQQQLNNQFFKASVLTYDQSSNSAFDSNLQLQKIVAFGQKMPLPHLKGQSDKILPKMNDAEKRGQIVKAIAGILRERNDGRGADMIEKKWPV